MRKEDILREINRIETISGISAGVSITDTVKDLSMKLKAIRPQRISRSQIEEYCKCSSCWHKKRKAGIKGPNGPGWSLNSAVDEALKYEHDMYRHKGVGAPHMPMSMKPFDHPALDEFRNIRKGITAYLPELHIEVFGAIDDIWEAPGGRLHVVDYKSTAKDEVKLLEKHGMTVREALESHIWPSYKRQLDIYHYILTRACFSDPRLKGYQMGKDAFFLHAVADAKQPGLWGKLSFDMHVVPYTPDIDWVNETLTCMMLDGQEEYIPFNHECSKCVHTQNLIKYEDVQTHTPIEKVGKVVSTNREEEKTLG